MDGNQSSQRGIFGEVQSVATQKVFDVQFDITKSGNIVVRVICDYLYHYAITEDIKKEIYPRLKSIGLVPVSLKNQEMDECVVKMVPASSGGFARVSDKKRLITLLIKVAN